MIPTPEQERDLVKGGWKRMPLAAEIAFFFLTLFGVAALYWVLSLFGGFGWLTLPIAIAAAEFLIGRYRFWRTGVEAGLWIGGLFALIFTLPHTGAPEALLAFAAAFALAGWRLRNSLFGTATAILFIVYLGETNAEAWAQLAGVAIGLVAAGATTIVWRRRSTDLLFAFLTIAPPVAGYAVGSPHEKPMIGIAGLFIAAAIADFILGARFRLRAPLIAGAVCVAISCIEVQSLVPLPAEAKMIGGGAAVFGLAFALMRWLRGRTTGITVVRVRSHELQEAMQIAATLPLATPAASDGQQPLGGGGEFGGAGASGDF